MRKLLFAFFAVSLLVIGWQASSPDETQAIRIEPVVWVFDKDYSPAHPDDSGLPVHTVYIKTHDGTNWMSTYDSSPAAISGPAKLKELIAYYQSQGIEVVAWFVPKGQDVVGQLKMAKEVIDTGVTALMADVEPYPYFCDQQCGQLAKQFWWQLRSERPAANLGTIYDPRPWHYAQSGTADWLSVSNIALPMCYWGDFKGQDQWGDPAGCVLGAHGQLGRLTGGRAIDYVPMLDGNSSPEQFMSAVRASMSVGSWRVSIWRRGTTTPGVWNAVASVADPIAPRSANLTPWSGCRGDGCLLREGPRSPIYVTYADAKFLVRDMDMFRAMALNEQNVRIVPAGYLNKIPNSPPDGMLLRDGPHNPIYVIYGGAKYWIPDVESLHRLGFNGESVRTVGPWIIPYIPESPPDGALLRESPNSPVFVTYGAGKFQIPDMETFKAMGFSEANIRTIGPALRRIPDVPNDGTLVQELNRKAPAVVVGGAVFPVSKSALDGLGKKQEDIKTLPPGGLAQIPTIPAHGTLLKEIGPDEREGVEIVYLILGQGKFRVQDPAMFNSLGLKGENIKVVPDGALRQIPDSGDVTPTRSTLERLWVQSDGTKFWIPNPQGFRGLGFN